MLRNKKKGKTNLGKPEMWRSWTCAAIFAVCMSEALVRARLLCRVRDSQTEDALDVSIIAEGFRSVYWSSTSKLYIAVR